MNEIVINGYKIYYNRISNTELLNVKSDLIKPEVPKSFIESQNRWVENPFNPDYPVAMNVYLYNQGEARLNHILNSIALDGDIKINITKRQMELFNIMEHNLDPLYLFKKYVIFESNAAKEQLINLVCLTENRVYAYFENFIVERNDIPIMEHGLQNAINTNLEIAPLLVGTMQLVHPIDEYRIATASNINIMNWLNNEYSLDNMANIIALYRMNKIIESHNEDQIAIEQEKKSKKGK